MTNIRMQNEKGVVILHGQNRKKKIQMEQSNSDLGIMGCLSPTSRSMGCSVEYLRVGPSP